MCYTVGPQYDNKYTPSASAARQMAQQLQTCPPHTAGLLQDELYRLYQLRPSQTQTHRQINRVHLYKQTCRPIIHTHTSDTTTHNASPL